MARRAKKTDPDEPVVDHAPRASIADRAPAPRDPARCGAIREAIQRALDEVPYPDAGATIGYCEAILADLHARVPGCVADCHTRLCAGDSHAADRPMELVVEARLPDASYLVATPLA